VLSGDAFNPSLESSATKGAHMVPVLNACEIDVATYGTNFGWAVLAHLLTIQTLQLIGNHDLDFGEEVLNGLSDQTEFPWVLSNMHQ
jgi:2',3'-cyclic-nucleotide 2'-phosphodiesterase (5'-nucleotidase family)